MSRIPNVLILLRLHPSPPKSRHIQRRQMLNFGLKINFPLLKKDKVIFIKEEMNI
jgi:hypothetical protein